MVEKIEKTNVNAKTHGTILFDVFPAIGLSVSGEPGPISIKRGGNVTLNCYIRGSDYDGLDHTIKWVKVIDGKHSVVSANTIINNKLSEQKYRIIAMRDLPTYFLDLQLKIIGRYEYSHGKMDVKVEFYSLRFFSARNMSAASEKRLGPEGQLPTLGR